MLPVHACAGSHSGACFRNCPEHVPARLPHARTAHPTLCSRTAETGAMAEHMEGGMQDMTGIRGI